MKQKLTLLLGTLPSVIAQTQNLSSDTPTNNFLLENKEIIALLLLLILVTAAVYLDKRHGSRYIAILRRKGSECVQRLRRRKPNEQKLAADDGIPTSKDMHTNIFDSEKTYVEADLCSIQETALPEKKEETLSSLEMEEEAPKVDLREVFGQKDGQNSKRSKSKIRNRVQIKKSERESEDSQETKESKDANNSFEINAEQ